MKFLILGGGVAGLIFASLLQKHGENSFLLLEMENEAGGLCRSTIVDGHPLDIGGGHFLDTKRKQVNDYLFSFMPENEWNIYERNSQIDLNGTLIGHPFESNIWQLPLEQQVAYIKSIAYAGCNMGISMPDKFVDWITWKLGELIANNYMLPYNSKMFGDNLNLLGTYWMEKLPNVSLDETIISCLEHRPYGQQPGHAHFYYPKNFGYGELWTRIANKLGNHIELNKKIVSLTIQDNEKIVKTADGAVYIADYVISTIPWQSIEQIIGVPDYLRNIIGRLKHTSIEVRYFPEKLNTSAHWIYYPDKHMPYHRILVRHNFSLGNGYWTETNMDRVREKQSDTSFINDYAYPLNTIGKNDDMKELLSWLKSKGIYGLGRWGNISTIIQMWQLKNQCCCLTKL